MSTSSMSIINAPSLQTTNVILHCPTVTTQSFQLTKKCNLTEMEHTLLISLFRGKVQSQSTLNLHVREASGESTSTMLSFLAPQPRDKLTTSWILDGMEVWLPSKLLSLLVFNGLDLFSLQRQSNLPSSWMVIMASNFIWMDSCSLIDGPPVAAKCVSTRGLSKEPSMKLRLSTNRCKEMHHSALSGLVLRFWNKSSLRLPCITHKELRIRFIRLLSNKALQYLWTQRF